MCNFGGKMKILLKYLAIVLFSLPLSAQQTLMGSGKCALQESENKIDIYLNDMYFTSYLYSPEMAKPVLYPVHTTSGTPVTRGFPLNPVDGESTDHPHHIGISFSFGDVNGIDFWAATKPPPQIKHIATVKMIDDTLQVRLNWICKTGKTVLEELRTMRFTYHYNKFAIDFTSELTAKDTTAIFNDTKEGFFALRVADWLNEEHSGVYTNAQGIQKEANVWGKRSEWMQLEGSKDGKKIGVIIYNHPQSVNYPTYWMARGYGLFSANPLGQRTYQEFHKYKEPKAMNLRLEPGEKALFKFLVVVYENDISRNDLEELFTEYTTE
jgi:hypothetical protein